MPGLTHCHLTAELPQLTSSGADTKELKSNIPSEFIHRHVELSSAMVRKRCKCRVITVLRRDSEALKVVPKDFSTPNWAPSNNSLL